MGFVEAGNSRLQAHNVREEETVLQRFFGVFKILEHAFRSEHFQKSICYGRFSLVLGRRLVVPFHEREMQMFFWIFSKFSVFS